MPRVRAVRREDAAETLGPIFDRAVAGEAHGQLPGPTLFASQIEVLAHTPGILRGLSEVYRWFGTEGRVPRKYHELAIVVVSNINRCTYCVSHHTPFARELGAGEVQMEALRDGSWKERRELFDDVEWDVVEYAEQVTLAPWKLREAVFERLRRHFDDSQIVELTARITLCSFWNKFNDAMGLELESGISEVALAQEQVAR